MKATTQAYKDAMARRVRRESHIEIKAYHGEHIYVYQDDSVITATKRHDIDILSRKLPTESFTFALSDVSATYDPETPSGEWAALDKNDKIEVRFGIKGAAGIEWLSPDTYFLDGKPSASKGSVSFAASTRLLHATKRYYKMSGNMQTLNALAISVLQDAGITQYSLDPCLALIKTRGAIIDTHRNILQRIAHAASCALYTSGDTVIIKRIAGIPANTDAVVSLGEIVSGEDKTKKSDPPYSITVNRYDFSAEEDAEEIYSAVVDVDGSLDFHAEFERAEGVFISVSPGATVKSSRAYAKALDTVINGSGTYEVSIFGRRVRQEMYRLDGVVTTDTEGGTDTENNELITDSTVANAVLYFTAQELGARIEREARYRGSPEIEVGDTVSIDRVQGADVGIVTSNEIRFDGAISGTIKAKIAAQPNGAPLMISGQIVKDSAGEEIMVVGDAPYETAYTAADINAFITAVI